MTQASVELGEETRSLADGGLLHLVADAYRVAALEGANMRRAADALEPIRNTTPPDAYFDVWKAVDREIGLANDAALLRTLRGLRERFVDVVVADELARLERVGTADAAAGWTAWLRSYAAALYNWRWPLLLPLVEAPLPFEPETAAEVAKFRDWTRLARYDRWPEANGLLLYVGQCDALSQEIRAAAYVYSAQVQLYHLFLPKGALPLLEQAQELAPDSATVAVGWAHYDFQRGEYKDTCKRCEQVIDAHPDNTEAYNLLGQAFDRQDELEAAEHSYLEAQRVDPGDSAGYTNLLRLYGRPDMFAANESRLMSLLDVATAVEPEATYNAYVNMAIVYQQNGRYADAHAWYDKAVELDRERDNAYAQQGYAFLDEGRYADAERAFRTVVDVAPNAFDGYWGLAGLYETEERWDEALEQFRESLKRRPEWRPSVLARTGSILVTTGRYDEAEQDLFEALRLEPGDETTAASIERLVAACYDDPARTEASLRILEQTLEIKGCEYEHTYWNLVGNIHYYFERYDDAIQAYGRAIEIQPQEPVFHSNVCGAWEKRRRPGARTEELEHAVAAARTAAELDPANAEYSAKVAALVGEQTLVRVSGERALELRSAPPLRVDVSKPLLPSVLDDQLNDVSNHVLGLIEEMRWRIKTRTGILVPGIRFRELDSTETAYVVAIYGTRLPIEYVQSEKLFCPAPLDPLVELDIPAEVFRQSLPGAWVAEENREAAEAGGIKLWTPVEYMLGHLESILLSQLDQFVDHRQVALVLEESGADERITASPSLFTEFVVALRALAREHVPIVAVKPITEAFLAASAEGVNRVEIVERLRALPEVAGSLPGNDPRVSLAPLDQNVEAGLEEKLVHDGVQPVLALPKRDPGVDLRALQARPRHEKQLCLVVGNPELRPFVWALVESVPDVCVMSRAELAPERQGETSHDTDAA